ncbi:histidine phosphatase family protein [Marinobacter nauticus]|jgi:alpha-ribazole phosphatase|uniref:histidine phosphatase family protein n=1 Tax=Marinobacter nauticus TaxID=2743 RepID=UPI001C97111E|nr:alpha-ribazole phosphatase family protein [Marinobacter nauticus]MBY6101910.1 alpha-ribazole phosphatase family protein [Marinobacter nauticus]MBY6221872.1 alpha-ribazole phosphatase family protein [Marinobacter nauticus]MCA0914564.1 alpha-ribazole phosphatase family protein [Marinobacter nauticus]
MTTTVIDLIRHGEPEGGQMFRGSKDDPLSDTGWQQMIAAIAEGDQWDAIVSSPMQRCQHFAQQLADEHRIPLHIEKDLREIGFGEWEGLTAGQIQERYGDHLNRFWQDPIAFRPPGGEAVTDFYQRTIDGFDRWQQTLAGKRVLVVCHGGVIRMVLANVLGIPLERSFTGFAVPYACRSRIQVDQSEFGVFRSLISHQP